MLILLRMRRSDSQKSISKIEIATFISAYETLSDDNKRRVYDQVGMTGDEQEQYGGADPFGAYSSFFR